MPIDKNDLRRVMGHFATGVTIITTVSANGQLHGLTANAFTSVSLEPPLLLISVDKKAESYPSFEQSKVFTVNYPERQSGNAVAQVRGYRYRQVYGCGLPRGRQRSSDSARRSRPHRMPALCRYDGGDHTLYLGEIIEAETREGKPLLFYRGGYRALSD